MPKVWQSVQKGGSKMMLENINAFSNVLSQPLPLLHNPRHKVYNVKDMFKKDETPSLNDFTHFYSLSFLLALDSCNLPKETVAEVMEKVYENAECMLSGHINQRDVEKMARDTYGIEFVEGLRNRLYVVGDKIIKA